MTRIRTRPINGPNILLGIENAGQSNERSYYTYDYGIEQCLDETHPGPPYLTGGPLYVQRQRVFTVPSSTLHLIGNGIPNRTYDGGFTPNYSLGATPALVDLAPYEATTVAYGTKGWRRFRPGKPESQVGQFIGELHQIPTIPKSFRTLGSWALRLKQRAFRFKEIGDDFLNAEYGWAPFIRDLTAAVKLANSLDKDLAQLKRDNGQSVRRGGTVYSNTTTSSSSGSDSLYPILSSEFYENPVSSGTYDQTITTSEKHRFKAKFRYWIPDIESPGWTTKATLALYELIPTPSLVWELMPWSWMIDWFTTAGDVVSNMSYNAADNLAAAYAFGMSTFETTTVKTARRTFRTVRPVVKTFPVEASIVFTKEVKTRAPASPYGFGVTSLDLSDKQMLILSALGIQRSGF